MALDLAEQLFTVEKVLTGTDNFDVAAGDRLKILAGDVEIYNQKVSNGKKWRVSISVKIEESQS
jgi:hypothetical protein